MFFTSNCCFQLKYESLIHNIAFSNGKVISPESEEKYTQIKHHLESENTSKQFCTNMLEMFNVRGQQGMDGLNSKRFKDECASCKQAAFHNTRH